METLLRKYLWAIDLLVIAICAVFSARATATLIQTRITRIDAAGPQRSARAGDRLDRHVLRQGSRGDPQAEHLLFDLPADPREAGGSPTTERRRRRTLQRTSLPLRLLAVMFAPPPGDPRWSVAIIRDTEDHSVGPYSIGSKIREATISDIDEDARLPRDQRAQGVPGPDRQGARRAQRAGRRRRRPRRPPIR